MWNTIHLDVGEDKKRKLEHYMALLMHMYTFVSTLGMYSDWPFITCWHVVNTGMRITDLLSVVHAQVANHHHNANEDEYHQEVQRPKAAGTLFVAIVGEGLKVIIYKGVCV